MKTAEEVATLIYRKITGIYPSDSVVGERILDYITEALTDYGEERYQRGLEDGYLQSPKRSFLEARAEALEEAAKVSDGHKVCEEGKCWYDIGEEIRALKDKP